MHNCSCVSDSLADVNYLTVVDDQSINIPEPVIPLPACLPLIFPFGVFSTRGLLACPYPLNHPKPTHVRPANSGKHEPKACFNHFHLALPCPALPPPPRNN